LLEIAQKEKYKNINLNIVLYTVLLGCPNGEFDYVRIYKNLDNDIRQMPK